MTKSGFKKLLLNGAILYSLSVSATYAQDVDIEEKDAYLMQFNAEYADGEKVVSNSREVLVGRARDGEYSQVYMDLRNGAVTVETLEGTDTKVIQNNTPTELSYVYDYKDDIVHGNDEFSQYFNNYISRQIGDGNAVSQEASWTQGVKLSALGFLSADNPEINIEISRRFEGEADQRIAIIEFNVPAFEYQFFDGTKFIQWGQGVAVTDDMFGTLHVMGASHRAVIIDQNGNKRPLAMKTTAYGMTPDGSLRLDMDGYPMAQQAINMVSKTTSGDIHPAHYDVLNISANYAPFDLANGIQLLAFAAGEKSANMLNMVNGMELIQALERGENRQELESQLTPEEIRNLTTQLMIINNMPGASFRDGQNEFRAELMEQINQNSVYGLTVPELIDVLDLANKDNEDLTTIMDMANQSANLGQDNTKLSATLQNLGKILNDPSVSSNSENGETVTGGLLNQTMQNLLNEGGMDQIRNNLNGILGGAIVDKISDEGGPGNSPLGNADFVQMISALGNIGGALGLGSNEQSDGSSGGLLSNISNDLSGISGLLNGILGSGSNEEWHLPVSANSTNELTESQLGMLGGLSAMLNGGGLSNSDPEALQNTLSGLSSLLGSDGTLNQGLLGPSDETGQSNLSRGLSALLNNNPQNNGSGGGLFVGNLSKPLMDLMLNSLGGGSGSGYSRGQFSMDTESLLQALGINIENGEMILPGDLTENLDNYISQIAREAEAENGGIAVLREVDLRDPNDPTWLWGRDDEIEPPTGYDGNTRPTNSNNPLGLTDVEYREEMARRKMELDAVQLRLMMEQLYEEAEREERWRKRREGEGIFKSDNFYTNTENFFDNNAMKYGDMIGYIDTDLSKWEEWLSTQDIAKLTRLAIQAGYPREAALAAALADADNLIRNARDEGYRRWANTPPSCIGIGGCGPQYLERWAMKSSQLALGDILIDARGIFSTAGLSDISITGFQLGYILRDFGIEDGDIVDVTISQFGRSIFNTEISLLNAGTDFNVNLRPGVASVEIRAVNEGALSPNTAEINIDNVVSGDAIQTYSLNTGEVAVLRVEPGN